MARPRAHLPYVVATLALWGVVLPGILVADSPRPGIPWREPAAVAVAVVVAAAGAVLVHVGAKHLAAAGVQLFGVRPAGVLVTDGVYARMRNPIDAGATLVALATWLALDLALGWVIPAAALISFVAGVGPYEDRLLLEEFDDEFREYRRSVPKWRIRSGEPDR